MDIILSFLHFVFSLKWLTVAIFGVSCDIGDFFYLYIDLKKLWGGWVEPWDLLLPSTLSYSNLLPPPSYSSYLLLPPPKPPPNSSYLLLKGLRWLISSYMKRFQCYSAQKSFMVGGWWWRHCNYSYKLQVKVSYLRFEMDLWPGPELDKIFPETILSK